MPVGRWVRRTARIGPVDVLAAGTRGAVGVHLEIALVDVDLDAIVDHRKDPDAGEAGMAPGLAVEGRDAHQAMDARLGLEPAIGIETGDLDGDRLDAGLLARGLLDPLDLVAVRLGPAQIHAQQHLGPVLRLGAAGAGIDLEEGVVGVGLAREHALQLQACHLLLERQELLLDLAQDRLVTLRLGELGEIGGVGEPALERALTVDRLGEAVAFPHQALRLLGVAPEVGCLREAVQLLEADLSLIPVKDASAEGPGPP